MNVVPLNAVIVGLDRSDPGRAAVEYAADLANRRHLPLRLLHAFEPSQYADRTTIGWREDVVALRRNSAQRLVDDTLEVLGILYPDLDVSAALHFGSATDMLIKASKGAHTVVLGSRGAGGFADLVIGSTTLHVASHAACPVIAVPGLPYAEEPRHGVVVGVDGSQVSEAAIGYAFEAASDVGETLTAVHAWYDPAHTGVGLMMPLATTPPWPPARNGWSWLSRWPAGRRSSPTSRWSTWSSSGTRCPHSCRMPPTPGCSSSDPAAAARCTASYSDPSVTVFSTTPPDPSPSSAPEWAEVPWD